MTSKAWQKIGSLVARMLIWLIPGWVIFESIREFNRLFDVYLNPYIAIVLAALGYVSLEIIIKKWKADEKTALQGEVIRQRLDRFFYPFAWILFASLFLAILLVWAGTLYKQISTGYERYDIPMK